MSNEQAIKDRIQAREEAAEILGVWTPDRSQAYLRAFALAMREFADRVLGPAQSELRVMDDAEAAAFERELIGYGRHKGVALGEVPISYLTWVADSTRTLFAYLRSDRGRARIERDE